MNEATDLEFISELVGEPLRTPALFRQALTHGSFGDKDDYQRLEFLGDRVLGLIIASTLYERHSDESEGMLSRRLNQLVSRESCAEMARVAGVPSHIRLGKQANDDGGRNSTNILGDVMEALIGATYLDFGIETTSRMVTRLWSSLMGGDKHAEKHPKSALQEWTARARRKPPVYTLIERDGPGHALRFTVEVSIKGLGSARATGGSKQDAETSAAKNMLEKIENAS